MARPHAIGIAWTDEEEDLLMARINGGEKRATIARTFPNRSEKAVLTKIANLTNGYNGEFRDRMARRSGKRLLEALLDAQTRFANLGGLTLEEAQAVLLGGNYASEAIPGTERVYRGQMAERKLAA